MLEIGDFRAGTCSGVTRRSFLRFGSSLPVAFGLAAASTRSSRTAGSGVRTPASGNEGSAGCTGNFFGRSFETFRTYVARFI